MKLISTLFLLLLLALSCFAQNAQSDGAGVTVVKKKWHRELRDPALDRSPDQDTDGRQMDSVRRREINEANDSLRTQGILSREMPEPQIEEGQNKPDRTSGYVYEVTVRNDGSREISSVTWEYVFLALNTDQEVGRRRFTSKVSIPPTKTRTLTVRSAIPPTGTIDAGKMNSKAPEQYTEKIVVVSVDYSDGFKWPAISRP